MGFVTKSIDARSAGVGDLAVGLWIAEGARRKGIDVLFVSGGYDPLIKAFGHQLILSPTDDCLYLGGTSDAYSEELDTSICDVSPRTLRWQRTVGWDFAPCRPVLTSLDPDAVAWATGMAKGQTFVIIAPRSAHCSRTLPVQKWIRTAWTLFDMGIRTIAIDRDKEIVESFPYFVYGYDWHHVLALCSLANVVAGNDSGIPPTCQQLLGVPQ